MFYLKNNITGNKKLILGGFIVLMFIHVLLVFAGFYGNDDINYSRYAADIANNGHATIPLTSHFQLRWATIYSTAFFYKLFDINAFTSTLSSVISFCFCATLLYKLFKAARKETYILILAIFFFGHSIIFYSHRLLPDSTICLAVFWMYFSYRVFIEKKANALLMGIQFAFAFFLNIITKETVIIVLPLFAILFLKDIFKKQNFAFWKYAISFAALFVVLYLLYFKITTGSFFYRYQLLILNSYTNECSFNKLPFIYTLKRIAFQLWRAMLLNGDLIVILLAVAAVFYRKKISEGYTYNLDTFSFVILLFCANFMTISFTKYVPLCHDPRHFIFLMPFAAIVAGPMIYHYFKNPLQFVLLPIFFIVATVIIFLLHGGTTKYLYLLFALLFTIGYLISLKKIPQYLLKIGCVTFVMLFFLNYLIDFIKPMYPYYWDHKKVIEKNFISVDKPATVFSADPISAELSEYFLNFKTGNIKFYSRDSIKNNNTGKLYYLINTTLDPKAKIKMDSILKNNYATHIVAEHKTVFLYELPDSVLKILK